MAEKGKNKIVKIIAIVMAIIVILFASFFIFAEISLRRSDKWKPWRPNYEALSDEEIENMLQKDLSAEDYKILYEQTGLTEIGINRLLQADKASKIITIHQGYFTKFKLVRARFAMLACIERIDGLVGVVPLEPGDIVISSSTHVLGWRYGHAKLVVDSDGRTLEAFSVGTKSDYSYVFPETEDASFMVFRPKVSQEIKQKVVEYAKAELAGLMYSVSVGVFSKKNMKNPDRTQCAHLVWQAYKKFGIDLDSNGGVVVKPQDISKSKHLELVQVYGFNPDKLWK